MDRSESWCRARRKTAAPEEVLVSDALAAPHLLPVEVANVLRRASRAGELPEESVAEALEAPVATLDGNLAGAAGPRCEFLLPDA